MLGPDGLPGLTPPQVWGVALAAAYALDAPELVKMLQLEGAQALDEATILAAKSAATIMAMNNVYYRSTHLMEDEELKRLPVRLRMNVIGKPGVDKMLFEAMCFAVSALAGCGQCLTAHGHEMRKAGASTEYLQGLLRLTSVLSGVDRVLRIREL